MKSVRYEMRMAADAAAVVERLAMEQRKSRSAVIHDAIALLDATDRRPDGHYVGVSPNRDALTEVILGAR